MAKIPPTYLGDGLYIQHTDAGLVLSTDTHILMDAGNIIYIEPEVAHALHSILTTYLAMES
jgi:hypothetical protein